MTYKINTNYLNRLNLIRLNILYVLKFNNI